MDDIETLRGELEAARAEMTRMIDELAGSEARVSEMEGTAASLRRELEEVQTARQEAVSRYRVALLSQSPELPPDLIEGDSIAALDRAAERARGLVAHVREQVLAAEASRPVPAGSPLRRPPDLSALSAAQKIRFGVAERAMGSGQ